jgi:hypothetical protein
MIIDTNSINRSIYFEINNCKFKLYKPYKSYPYNHDYSFKPLLYFDSKGRKIKLPIPSGTCSHPIYDKDLNYVGMYVQQNEIFSFKKAMVMKFPNIKFPTDFFGFTPVDTLRFDTSIPYSFNNPSFLKKLTSQLRNLSGQFWIGYPALNVESVTTEGIVKGNGIIDNFQFHSNLLTILRYNKGIPITLDILEEAISNVIHDNKVDFARTLFLDAIYQFAKNNYREVVMNLANSLDITVNKVFKEIANSTDADYDRDVFVKKHRTHKMISSTYIPGLISEFIESITGLNYKSINSNQYEIIREFWLNKRNIIAHGGDVKIEENESAQLFEAFNSVIIWLNQIETKNYCL